MSIFTLIFSPVKFIIDLISKIPVLKIVEDYVNGSRDLALAKQQTKMAAESNRQRLLLDKESHNHSWEMAELTNSDKWIRRISFAMFTGPFLIAIFSPESVNHYFTIGIASIPEWYKQTYMAITGAVWGISNLKNIVPSIVSVFKQ